MSEAFSDVVSIIENEFSDELQDFVQSYIDSIDEDELQLFFDEFIIELADLDGIESIQIDECYKDEDDEVPLGEYYGAGRVNALVSGMVYHDGAYHTVEQTEMEIPFSFSIEYSDLGNLTAEFSPV